MFVLFFKIHCSDIILVILVTSSYFGGGRCQTNVWVGPLAHCRSAWWPFHIRSFAQTGTNPYSERLSSPSSWRPYCYAKGALITYSSADIVYLKYIVLQGDRVSWTFFRVICSDMESTSHYNLRHKFWSCIGWLKEYVPMLSNFILSYVCSPLSFQNHFILDLNLYIHKDEKLQ